MATSATLSRCLLASLLTLLLIVSTAAAQESPRVTLDSTSFVTGDEATLTATGLEPGGEYRLVLDPPEDEEAEIDLAADDAGELTHLFVFDAAGEWVLRFLGEGLSATLTVEVDQPGEAGAQSREEGRPAAEGAAAEQGADETDAADGQDRDEPEAAAEPDADEPATDEQDADEQDAAAERDVDEPGAADGEAAEADEAPEAVDETATTEEAAATADDDRPQADEPLTVTTDGDALIATRGTSEEWRLDFPPGSGRTGAVLEAGEIVWLGHGNSVLAVDRMDGQVLARHAMPGRVLRLEAAGDAVSVVTDVDGRIRQRIEVDEDGPQSLVRFGTDPETFQWLRLEANVEDPRERLEQDPTNAWLHLAVGLDQRPGPARRDRLEAAVERGSTFYDLAGIARKLFEADERELAREAMNRALNDFAERGYDPRLLASAPLHRAYDFPLAPMEEALDRNDLDAAGFWAPWLHLTASEEAPATQQALLEYSRRLSQAGQRDAASLWRERAQGVRSSSPAASLDRFFLALGSSGWYGVAAMLTAILAMHLTLIAKYWAPQSLAIRRSRETGGRRKPWARLLAIRYYSFTEKLVLVLLFAACLTLLGLTRWYDAAGERPVALASGTLVSPVARDAVTSAPFSGQRAAFIRGYAAQTAGEQRAASEEYLAAGDYPPALNNLGALVEDDVLYRRALELAPGMPEASYNLGRSTSPSPFHAAYLADEPLLAVPVAGDFRTAVAGSWQGAVGTTFENPWRALRGMSFFGAHPVVWQILLALFLVWMLVTIVWLVIPRPAMARNAPRTAAYHLLALLIPGSGLADEAWGVLLIVPWSLLGVDAALQLLGWERLLGLSLEFELWALGAIYLLNLIAFVVEFISYRRRMRSLQRRHPEAMEAYGPRA